MIVRRFKK